MNSADILIALFFLGAGFLCAVFGYATGHRTGKAEGNRQGFARGRGITRTTLKTEATRPSGRVQS